MQQNSKEFLKTFIPIMLVVAIFILIGIAVVRLTEFTATWFLQLDARANEQLFATLAGLALAAASFLTSSVGNQSRLLEEARGEVTRTWERTRQEDIQDREHAEKWFDKNRTASKEEIDKVFSSPFSSYLQARRVERTAARTLGGLVESRKAILFSFFCFLFGLIEAMTLDIWSGKSGATTLSEMNKAHQVDTWFFGFVSRITSHAITIVDVFLTAALLIAGLWFLWRGAQALLADTG